MGHGKKDGYASRMIKKKHRRRKRIRRMDDNRLETTTLQELFVSCKDAFKGPGTVPSSFYVQKLCSILDNMKPEDVGLSRESQFFKASGEGRGTPRVTYTTIYQCDKFSFHIFFLPATAVIPLHNHPGMTVFTKLLLGTMHIKSYDWVDRSNSDSSLPSNSSRLRLARLEADNEFREPCDTNVLYPKSGGNIHEFTAITPCAVLDVVGPPYSAKDGRDCSYYKDFPCDVVPNEPSKEERECYGWLEEIEMPEDSHMDGIEYLGPQVLDA